MVGVRVFLLAASVAILNPRPVHPLLRLHGCHQLVCQRLASVSEVAVEADVR